MSFDQDQNEQANISGADLAIMVDEFNLLKKTNAELLEALIEVVAISDRKHEIWDKAKAAIAKATGESA